ncbi:MAG: sulfatase family protein [Blastocatellia bacterium]
MKLIRRELIITGALTLAAALLTQTFTGVRATVSNNSRQQTRPNILWILAEDISPQLSCYGEPLVQTPNIDKLASQGARFTRAFTTAPVCSASRSALITGMYQTSIGAHNHRTFDKKPLPSGVKIITDYLHEAGYFTVLSGKGPSKKDSKEGGPAGSGKTDFNFIVNKPFDGYDWNQRQSGQPFFAQLSLQESHRGYGWPLARKTLKNLVDPNKVKLPPYWPDHPIARDEYANYLDAIQLVDSYVGVIMKRLEDEGLADNTVVFFLGDNGSCLFRGKQFLYDGGISVPLIIRWPGKIKPGTVREDFVEGIDLAAASLKLAGISPPANMQGRDFLSPNHQEREYIIAARDRMDIAIDRMRAVRTKQFKYIRNFIPGIPYMQRNPYKEREYPTWNLVKQLKAEGKLTPVQALFAADQKPLEELYDVMADPHEINNLAEKPEYKQTLLQMRRILDRWIKETGDQGATLEDPIRIYESYFSR